MGGATYHLREGSRRPPVRFSAFKENCRVLATSDDGDIAVERTPPPHADDAAMMMLRLALDGLPVDQRAAIRLALIDRLTLSEIAHRLGSTRQDVQMAMRDGLHTLRDVLRMVDPAMVAEQGTLDA